jgi:hypothetical protein
VPLAQLLRPYVGVAEWDVTRARAGSYGVPELQTRVRFPLALPTSLQCREIGRDYPGNRAKWPQFRVFCVQTGPEKMPSTMLQASVAGTFSRRHLSSPVSATPSGEWNAITNRSCGESGLDFCSLSEASSLTTSAFISIDPGKLPRSRLRANVCLRVRRKRPPSSAQNSGCISDEIASGQEQTGTR